MHLKITNEVFEYVANDAEPTSELYSLRIRKGRFKNVIFTFGKVQFTEDKDNEELKFNFNFYVNKGNTRYTKEKLNNSTKFKNFIAEILQFILKEQLLEHEQNITTNT